ncbi:Mobile element protein [Candidatus Enterovibrio altilux]|uniref:Mobile element protein n=1 Tax=Candidatus Enterovibrio altilux TaxID=1927128 RepID=A0A291B8N8_9GAMM|nr:Mobile element protein [Candidatus Enterovibrio luxaltus]
MFRVKKLFEGTLSLRDYNCQISPTYAIIKILNKLVGSNMPNMKVIV